MCRRLLSVGMVVAAGLSVLMDSASAQVPASLIGWWKLDDASGATAKDSSGKKHDGTLVGGPVWVAGKIGGGLEFAEERQDFVRIPDDPSMAFSATSSYTLAAWVYVPQVPTGWNGVVCKGRQSGGGAAYYGIWIGDNSGVPTWYYGAWPTWGSPVAVAGWYHVVVVQDGAGGTKKLYLNGAMDAQTVAQASDAAGAMVFGSDQEPGDSFEGIIDDVQLYNKALSNKQMTDLLGGILPTWLKAEKPNPADGAIGVASPLLTWSPGESARFHNVYLGTTAELTAADLVGVRLPFAIHWHLPGLQPGVTYFWRVDEIEADGVTIHVGDVWSFTAQPLTAFNPKPANGAEDVFQAPALTWLAGQNAPRHQVYFGDNLDAVAAGAADTDKGSTTEKAFSPGLLRSGTVYYWRVDELVVGGKIEKGSTWSFVTEPPADNKIIREWWSGIAGTAVGVLRTNPKYPDSPSGRELIDLFEGPIDWADIYGSRLRGWLTPAKSGEYTFWIASDDGSELWLSTDANPANVQMIANVSTYTGSQEWTKETNQKSAPITLQAGQKYYIEALMKEGTSADNVAVAWQPPGGAQEVISGEFMDTYALAPIQAAAPDPKNGAVDVVHDPILSWYPGEKAQQHEVYFGEDAAAIAAADASSPPFKGRQTGVTFDPGSLEWGKTYSWRIDEIAAGDPASPWKGRVWTFGTANFLPIDDMESYTDEQGSRIYETWIDGFTTKASGSTVGYLVAPFAETTIVHGGRQSMPLDYNNINSPFFSEAEREFSPVQNWTASGVDALTLYFHGKAINGLGELYVMIEDGAGMVLIDDIRVTRP